VATTAAPTRASARPSRSGLLSIFRRRGADEDAGDRFLVIGLGNPGDRYAATRHNIGFRIGERLTARWDLPKPRTKYGALLSEGRTAPGGPRVALLLPQTFMNDSGSAAGPARGSLKVPIHRVVVLHDEIDLPFGEVRVKFGGGVAGHNGLKSLRQGLGDPGFWRVRAGVGRPDSTDPDVVSSYVLSRFREPREEVEGLVDDAARETERLVERVHSGEFEAEDAVDG